MLSKSRQRFVLAQGRTKLEMSFNYWGIWLRLYGYGYMVMGISLSLSLSKAKSLSKSRPLVSNPIWLWVWLRLYGKQKNTYSMDVHVYLCVVCRPTLPNSCPSFRKLVPLLDGLLRALTERRFQDVHLLRELGLLLRLFQSQVHGLLRTHLLLLLSCHRGATRSPILSGLCCSHAQSRHPKPCCRHSPAAD